MPQYYLGISAFYHDAAAALVADGLIVAAAQEERFSRLKGDAKFPNKAIAYCLSEAGITVEQLSAVVFYDKPILKFDRLLASYIHSAPRGLASFVKSIPIWLREKLWTEDVILKELGFDGDFFCLEHHQSHAASAFYPSPFEEAAIVTVDGAGEWKTTTIGKGEGNSIKLLMSIDFPHSLGLLYSAFTYYCGFKVNSGEYKLMGLAPYGNPRFLDVIQSTLTHSSADGAFSLNQTYFSYLSGLKMINKKFEKLFGRAARKPDETIDQFHMDMAASIQEFLNLALVRIAKYARQITGSKNLVIAGGVGLNCVANSRIKAESGFENIWVQPAAGDAGGALGAALFAWYGYRKNQRVVDSCDAQKGSLLGPQYSQIQVEAKLTTYNAKFYVLEQEVLFRTVAGLLAEQKVVAWYQGRMEFGPRALGSRSILADPRNADMQSAMNLKIKFRESFRPFAPAILEDMVSEYFDWKEPSPYMLFTAQVRKEHLLEAPLAGLSTKELLKVRRSTIPAVTHLDNSARIQTVSRAKAPELFGLLSKFYELTGCPILINTSFNVRGEPIVESPSDAYRCFMGSNIDVLVLGNVILYREEQPEMELKQWKKSLVQD